MATHTEVTKYLRPNGGYVQVGTEYEGITFEPQCEPFTKEEYLAAFDLVDAVKIQQETEAAAKRQAALDKLAALGLEPDDLKALGL